MTCVEHIGRSTAVRCKDELMKALGEYKLPIAGIVALVTDTEATMGALGDLMDCDHHYCLAHLLELVTVRVLIANRIDNYIEKFV